MSAAALRQAVTTLQGLYAFLAGQNYLIGDSFAALARPREEGRALGSRLTLTMAQWELIKAQLDADMQPASAATRRCARAIR